MFSKYKYILISCTTKRNLFSFWSKRKAIQTLWIRFSVYIKICLTEAGKFLQDEKKISAVVFLIGCNDIYLAIGLIY